MMKKTALTLMLVSLICAGCATTGDGTDENEPTLIDAAPPAEVAAAIEEAGGEEGPRHPGGEDRPGRVPPVAQAGRLRRQEVPRVVRAAVPRAWRDDEKNPGREKT